MPVSTEGTDLGSWIANRDAFRQQAKDAIKKMEECQRELLVAVGSRRPDPAVTFSEETVSGITALTQEAVNALQAAEERLPKFPSWRKAADAGLEVVRGRCMSAAQQRAREEAEQTAKKMYASRERQAWIKRNALRLASIGVLLATFFVLYKY